MAVIGLGIDLVDIDEAERMLERWGERLLKRLLTLAERDYVMGFERPAQHLAVRLAAKEAVYKALQTLPGAREVSWRNIEVVRRHDGHPSIFLHDNAARVTHGAGLVRISLSLTHSERTAGAVALIERD